MQRKLISLVVALCGVLIPLLASTAPLEAMSAVPQNDLVLTSNRDSKQYDTTFKGFNVQNTTTGAFEETLNNVVQPREGWTWKKVGDDIIVFNGDGERVATYHGAAQGANTAGAIEDNPDADGEFQGNWTRQ